MAVLGVVSLLLGILIAVIVLIGGFIAMVRTFWVGQRDLFHLLHRREQAEKDVEVARHNLRQAARDLRRLTDAYGQFLVWSRVLGVVMSQPFGPPTAAVTDAVDLQPPLPRSTKIGTVELEPAVLAQLAEDIRRDVFAAGWLSMPWQAVIDSAAALVGPGFTDAPEGAERDLLSSSGPGAVPLFLDTWSERVVRDGIATSGADALWQQILESFGRSASYAQQLMSSIVTVGQPGPSDLVSFLVRSGRHEHDDGSLLGCEPATAERGERRRVAGRDQHAVGCLRTVKDRSAHRPEQTHPRRQLRADRPGIGRGRPAFLSPAGHACVRRVIARRGRRAGHAARAGAVPATTDAQRLGRAVGAGPAARTPGRSVYGPAGAQRAGRSATSLAATGLDLRPVFRERVSGSHPHPVRVGVPRLAVGTGLWAYLGVLAASHSRVSIPLGALVGALTWCFGVAAILIFGGVRQHGRSERAWSRTGDPFAAPGASPDVYSSFAGDRFAAAVPPSNPYRPTSFDPFADAGPALAVPSDPPAVHVAAAVGGSQRARVPSRACRGARCVRVRAAHLDVPAVGRRRRRVVTRPLAFRCRAGTDRCGSGRHGSCLFGPYGDRSRGDGMA